MDDRGQISTIDVTVAFVLVLSILLSTMEVWNTGITNINRMQNKRTIDRKAAEVAELLVKTPGAPSGWHTLGVVDSATVESIGFATTDNLLDRPKLEKASTVEYGELKKILGLNKEDAHITVTDVSNSSRPVLCEIGTPADDTSVIVSRYGLLDGRILEVKVQLYYPKGSFMYT